MKICVPGLPIKRNNPCIDPQQSIIPHVITAFHIETINGKQKYTGKTYEPNLKYYPEYEYIIKMFIKEQKL